MSLFTLNRITQMITDMHWLNKVLSRIFILIGALVFSQMPFFISAYSQQLYGRIAELRLQKEALIKIAHQSGKTLDQYIYKFLISTDPDFHGQGEWMQSSINRLQTLTKSLTDIERATLLEKPFIFLKTLNWDIGKSTLNHFAVGLPLNLEGALYALVGACVGGLLFYCLKQILKGIAAPFKRKTAAPDA